MKYDLKARLEMVRNLNSGNGMGGRKEQVLNLLKEYEEIKIKDMGKRIGISSKNVSSQLSYLRGDGYIIGEGKDRGKVLIGKKDEKGNLFLWNIEKKEFVSEKVVK